MRKIILIAIFITASCSYINTTKSNKDFIFGTDIPLYENIKIINDKTTNFDSISGNISISTYKGSIKQKNEIMKFYNDSLAQLGWKEIDKNEDLVSYQRNEKETLKISFKESKKKLIIKFFVIEK